MEGGRDEREFAVGIDFGFSFCRIAVCWRETLRPETVINELGYDETPSEVACTDAGTCAGETARSQALEHPRNTCFGITRLMGVRYQENGKLCIGRDWSHLPFAAVPGKNKQICLQMELKNTKALLCPEQLAAEVLAQLKESAEIHVRGEVTRVVVTVPTMFSDAQRRSVLNACTLARLQVLRLISEPTALAMAYNLHKPTNFRNFLVYSLGGGSLSIAVFAYEDQVLETIAVGGNNLLGGEDFTARLVDHCLAHFQKQHTLQNSPVKLLHARSLSRLRWQCERAKKRLSSADSAEIYIECFFREFDFHTSITRHTFECICDDLFSAAVQPLPTILAEARKTLPGVPERVLNTIVLAGAATQMPKLRAMLRTLFVDCNSFHNVDQHIDPSLLTSPAAAAHGAAVQAALLADPTWPEESADSVAVVLDVLPHAIGIERGGGIFDPLVQRAVVIPRRVARHFTSYTDSAQAVRLHVFERRERESETEREGAEVLTRDLEKLGTFSISGIPPGPRGRQNINVVFAVTASGTVEVTAADETRPGRTSRVRTV